MPNARLFEMPIAARSAVAAFLLAASGAAAQEVTPNWFRSPAISPDGRTVVFTHGGDLYSVPVTGGRAVPLTLDDGDETRPVWSRDGSKIAFASDRFGNYDIFVMPATGGAATRLTFHSSDDFPTDFTPSGDAVLFESSRGDDVKSALFPSGILSELYQVSLNGGTPTMVLTTPAVNAKFDRAGGRLIYEDRKGYEDELRKHHTSPVARDLWVVDLNTGEHQQLTRHAAEDRSPHFSPDGRSILFLSERNGDFNLFRMPAGGDESMAQQLTQFEHHPVRHLSVADDGSAVFSWHGDLYHYTPSNGARRIPVEIGVDRRRAVVTETQRSGATEFVVAPSGKEVAFVVRGDVFVTSVEFDTTRRITSTPEQERSVDFAPDGRSIIYASERDGSWNIYQTSLEDDDELYFFSATSLKEEPLIATDAEEFQPKFSPDGKKIAYLHNRSTLRVYDVDSGETVTALPGTAFYSYSDGDYEFDWSPDSQWLAMHFYNRGRLFVAQIGVVKADGSQNWPIDISNSGYDSQAPQWAMDGGVIAWRSDRYGMRSHGSWGSQWDVVAAFLTQDAYDKFRLTREEYELQKELKEKREKEEKEKEKDKDKDQDKDGDDDSGDADDAAKDEEEDKDEKPEPVTFEFEGLETRIERLTIHASDLGGFALAPDGGKLYYLARFEKGFDLWVRDFRKESTTMLKKLGANSASMQLSDDGKTIFLLAGGSLSKIDADSGDQKSISFSAELEINGDAEREHLLEHVWRQTKQKFYLPDMHGVDWRFYREQYEPKLSGVTTNRVFAEVLSELLGELNASHTGGRYRPDPDPGAARTASLGVFYDNDYNGPGVRIVEIMEGGPLDKAELGVEAEMIITHINGVELTPRQNLYELLNRKAGERVRITVRNDAGESFDKVVRPISLGQENELRYQRWVRGRRAIVEEASNGRVGYMHVRGMNDPSYRSFYAEALGRHFDKEALIVDTRFNGGGWLHDDLVTFLTGKHYVDLYPRDDESPDTSYTGDSSWRWTKPSAVVMSEGNYSDAHFFPWAYSHLNIGDTVGMPVAGTATAVWWERLHTGDLIFGIPQVGIKAPDGDFLENQVLEPDHRVELDPESAAEGTDTQVLAAVRILLEKVDND